jgi:hypothetical protein
MPIQKLYQEFQPIDMDGTSWAPPPGYPRGIEEQILSGRLDEQNKTGSRTRLLRFRPGAYTSRPFVHDYWEEVYLISGELTVGNAEGWERSSTFVANTYACRPPGILHGPFRSERGCLLLEFHYYEPSASLES